MIFTDLYKSPRSPLSRLRHTHHPALVTGAAEYDPDLLSKDKARQKSAVKKHLQAKVRNDWAFTWPLETTTREDSPQSKSAGISGEPINDELEGFLEVASEASASDPTEAVDGEETALDSGEEGDSDSDAESVYSIISEDPLHWAPRLEWTSELSEDELPYNSPSPFKFETPDSIAQAITVSKLARQARRRKEIRKEVAWNDGLACFEARRNAWTGAKVARVRPKPVSPASASSSKRGLFWRTHSHSSNAGQTSVSPPLASPLTPTNSQPDAALPVADSENSTPGDELSPKTSHSSSQKQPESLPVETLLPIPPPLLPPANPMRASIQPQLYNSIYEKVVVHSLQPSCPINLSDMIRACVSGWKRDGEWPPRSTVPEPAAVVAVRRKKSPKSAGRPSATPTPNINARRLSFSFLSGRGGHDAGERIDKDRARRESNAAADSGSGGSGTGKAIRKSLQKVLGLGHSPAMVSVGDGSAIAVHGHGVA